MTPKEKAKDLIDKFTEIARGDITKETIDDYVHVYGKKPRFREMADHSTYFHAKKYASLAAEMVIKEAADDIACMGRSGLTNKEYWQKIKSEIEKL